jgi:hypothetical protein
MTIYQVVWEAPNRLSAFAGGRATGCQMWRMKEADEDFADTAREVAVQQ